jgi:hypothetical protein
MITAVDTSVLIAIDQGEPDASAWVELIASHAHVDCHRLACSDRGYLRHYFPDLTVITPPTPS